MLRWNSRKEYLNSKNVQRNEPEEKERGTSKSIKELILLIEEALTTYDK